jgi:predicted DNA-binding transcriptional regulator YafY
MPVTKLPQFEWMTELVTKIEAKLQLDTQLLWFGNDVEVLQPAELRQQIATKITPMHDLYIN